MKYGFIRAAACIPLLKVADTEFNAQRIIEHIEEAEDLGVEIIVFPELSVTSYTCADLFHQQALLDDAVYQLEAIVKSTKGRNIIVCVGAPVRNAGCLYNCGVIIQNDRILGVVPKTYIPGYKEFYEQRWFAPGIECNRLSVKLCGYDVPFGINLLFQCGNNPSFCFALELCEDLWAPVPPSSFHALEGAALICNLSASNDLTGKHGYRRALIGQQSARCICGYIYASAGVGESTTDVVFAGNGIIAENGIIIREAERFSPKGQLIISEIDIAKLINDRIKNTSFKAAQAYYGKGCYRQEGYRQEGYGQKCLDVPLDGTMRTCGGYRIIEFVLDSENADTGEFYRNIDPHPFVPSDTSVRDERCKEIFSIQTEGLVKRLSHTGLKHAHVGISGGLDSTLALLCTAKAFDRCGLPRKNITAVTMPGFGTTGATLANALELIRTMNVTCMKIDIREACLMHFGNIGHDAGTHDTIYENVQARERTQILMDLANKQGGLVVGTGDLSEMALGWSTYNGDHMSMYAVNCGIPKTLVRYLVEWAADNVYDEAARLVLGRILKTPITPELLPPSKTGEILQKTEDIIGPYELHDFFLYHMIRYGAEPSKMLFLASLAFKNTYSQGEVKHWLKVFIRRFFTQQFKRSCVPDGPKVGSISLSPRGDWRMPSDSCFETWMREIDK